MTTMTCKLASIGAAALALALAATSATAATRYAVIAVENATNNATVGMSFRWGEGEWKTRRLKPGERHYFCHKFDKPNENKNPPFHIKFDSDVRPGEYVERYHLKALAAADCGFEQGHKYKFKYEVKGKFVELYDEHK